MYKCNKEDLGALLSAINEKYALYVPKKHGTDSVSSFEAYGDGEDIYLSGNTDKGLKELFFPQCEEIARFITANGAFDVAEAEKQSGYTVIFGARACDIKGLGLLDLAFLSEPEDGFYKNRREYGVIVSLACSEPSETCFCSCFGIDPARSGDAAAILTGDTYYFEILTEKGKLLLPLLSSVCEKTDDDAEPERDKIRAKAALMPAARIGGYLPDRKTEELFDLPVWDKLSAHCLGCGTCTYLCPTCQCYDIKDSKTADGAVRCRFWDSCMYSDFTKMSAGQPRLTQKERYRQRFMHKLVYFKENCGEYGCVGCGRCVRKCPASSHIIKVIKELGKADER